MSNKSKKQFGVWMDSQSATIVGQKGFDGAFIVLDNVRNAGADGNSNENAANNQEISLTKKFFKEIASKMQNADEIHITGTGQIQEQFASFLNETPQYKNTKASESTSNRMSDEALTSFFIKHFN
ncbi:hypothetical protein [Flavobacterium selenitireducens]|uniref:hypothetical protein n=1 Tax=Flavobacterium selenitireducens TaxID=2722704 RepID=UPI00168BE197|nr:hypothetical protein [Flavobacterium selenitireducens]MBD3582803.1 hypothetical protein [Flavobacterium selenitireducens]